MKVSLADQIGAVQAALDGRIATEELAAALRTLQWLEKNAGAVRLAHKVTDDPAVKAILDTFEGSTIVDIKPL